MEAVTRDESHADGIGTDSFFLAGDFHELLLGGDVNVAGMGKHHLVKHLAAAPVINLDNGPALFTVKPADFIEGRFRPGRRLRNMSRNPAARR